MTISPVRHSNQRYSSIMTNKDLHKYLAVPITTHTHVRRKSIGKKKRKEKTDKEEKGHYIYRLKITLCQAEAGANGSYLLWAIYIWLLVCQDMAIWPLLCPERLYRDALGTNSLKEKTDKKEKGIIFRFKITLSSRSRRSWLLSVVGNIYGC